MALTLRHQTPAQFIRRLRRRYRQSEREDAIRIGGYLLAAIEAGDLNEEAVRTEWAKTEPEWAVFKSRLRSQVAARNVVRGAVGD